jgi:hypothetical protein
VIAGCDRLRLQADRTPGGGLGDHFDGFRKEQALLSRVFNHRVELVSSADQATSLAARYHGLLIDERARD